MSFRVSIAIFSQVARGMVLLEKNEMIHRDLAARNCLVSQESCGTVLIKICHFGLSWAEGKEQVEARKLKRHRRKLEGEELEYPRKWMALESLQWHTFSSKSDVWSFGIPMFEVLTHCRSELYVVS